MNHMIIILLILLNSLFSSINSYNNKNRKCSMLRMITLSSVNKQSTTDNSDNDKNNHINFAGVKFSYPLSSHIRRLGINTALPIQEAAISPLTTGLSCIIHSQTGSGKTLTYLLPLLKRLYNEYEDKKQWEPMQAMIIVPTKELVVQVAADIVSLTSEDNKSLNSSLIHICLTNSNTKTKVVAPIIIGTPIKILDMLRSTPSVDISKVQYLVIDEVDKIISALSKYATTEEKKDAKQSPTAISEILSFIRNAKSKDEFKNMQIIGASATIGRPLKREFFRILNGGEEFGNIPVISPKIQSESSSSKPKLELEDIDMNLDEKIVSTTRVIGIPSGIRHIAVLCTDESENLSAKLAVAKEQWVSFTKENPSRGMLFVPIQEDVKQAMGILKFWGIPEAKNLQSVLGITIKKKAEAMTKKMRNDSKNNKNNPRKINVVMDTEDGDEKSIDYFISRAARSKIGSTARLQSNIDDDNNNTDMTSNYNDDKVRKNELFIVPVSGMRGLHLQDVEYVLILEPPRTMDEYLHVAGRTGRAGNKVSTGTVITYVNLEQLKRLQSWQTPLGIVFEVEYQ